MSSTHDFRIEQQEFVKALAEYNNMKNTLQEVERELIDRKSNGLTHMGQSNAITDYSQDLTNFLSDGEYRHAYNLITGMQDFLEDILPVINYLCVRCEEFPLQLKQNEYKDVIAPAAGNNTARNGGILSITYQRVSNVMDECEEVLTKVDEVEKGLLSIASDCDDIAGLGSEIQAITDAAQKLRRIGNYAVSLSAYKSGIEALETEMEVRFNALVALNKQSLGSYEARDNDYIIEEQEKIDILGMCADNDINSIGDMMKTNPESVTEILNDILKKPANEWSNSEAEYVANVFNYGIEEKQSDIVELCLNGMMYDKTVNIRTEKGNKDCPSISYADYYVQADVNKINAVIEKLEKGEAADTLNRVSKLQLYTEVSTSSLTGNIEDVGNYILEVSLSNVGQIVISNKIFDNPNEDYFYENSWTITSCEVAEVVSAEGIRRLEREGFTEEEIDAMLSNTVTDGDIAFFAHLAKGKYEDAFDENPDLISDNMALVLVDYLTHFHEKYKEYGDEVPAIELKKIVNGIMKVDTENCYCSKNTSGGFLDIIQVVLLNNLNAKGSLIFDGNLSDSEEAVAIDNMNDYYTQYGFWAAMDMLYEYEHRPQDMIQHNYRYGYYSHELFELTINDAGCYNCKVNLIDNAADESADFLGENFININTDIISGSELAKYDEIEKIKELDQQRKDLCWKAGYDYIFGIFGDNGVVVGDAIMAMSGLITCDDVEWEDAAQAMLEFSYEKDLKYEDIKKLEEEGLLEKADIDYYEEENAALKNSVSTIIGVVREYRKITEQIEETKKKINDLNFSQAIRVQYKLAHYGSGDKLQSYETDAYKVGQGIILGKTLVNQRTISEEGLEGYFIRQGYPEEEARTMVKQIRETYAPELGQEGIYDGDSNGEKWYDADVEQIVGAISDIDGWLDGKKEYEHLSFGEWLLGG